MKPDHPPQRREPGARGLCVLFVALLPLALTCGAAIPAPEQLLPDDTLILLTAPDFTKLREI